MSDHILDKFHPVVRSWFRKTFGEPSPPQLQGWPSISDGNHTLIVAPTGSGKTLAAFLWCINHIFVENLSRIPQFQDPLTSTPGKRPKKKERTSTGVRVLYVSPLKALNNDIHRNLEIPLRGILKEAELHGERPEEICSAVRTGDTTQSERARMVKHPPDILITTPESLFLMLSSEKARHIFSTVQYVIVDEIHSISNSKRGVHLSISLERLEQLVQSSDDRNIDDSVHNNSHLRKHRRSFVRIGLSATQKPLSLVAQFLAGMEWKDRKLVPRDVTIIDAGYKKNVDLKVICAARDFSELPKDSIWSLIFPELLELIRQHKTTLIFVNNRRLAERIAAKLTDMISGEEDRTNNYSVPILFKKESNYHDKAFPNAEPPITIFAYHGSMSRSVRERLEQDLKSGILKALITTSALELGIDIGTVDLVVQIQSPKGIARGLQRVGRSGHLVDAHSKGRLFVTHREDLIESTVVSQGMMEHSIESTMIPQNCLDVVAQQIVAMVGIEEWNVDELFDLLRQSYCYRSLSETVFHSILSMLGGRYSTDAFRELRARIIWNKLDNSLSALPGSSLLALTNAGTIPDKGYFGVYLEDLKTKIGEVDEEFIYESRAGDTFILGSQVWRMMDIDANKVVVSPAPGQPARMPFWRGEGIGRTFELGVRIGEFLEHVSSLEYAEQDKFLSTFPVDTNSVRNIIEYVDEQREATTIVPTHSTIVVEGFRDEVGDPRIVVHSCYGKGVNGLLGIVLTSVLKERLNIDIQMLYNNDGILLRCSDVERMPLDLFSDITLHSAQQIILEEIPSSPLFGALFRQNAARALLLPKGSPGKRTPFFLQRLKSADLLQIVRQYNDFPIVVETVRECLTDVLDFEHFKEIIKKIEAEDIRIHMVQNETPSPFASTLLFDFAAVYMYQWDEPKDGQKQQFALLNRELLSEVINLERIRSVVRSDAVAKVEEQLQFTARTRKARTPEELMEVFLRLGEMTEEELHHRIDDIVFIDTLKNKHFIAPITIGEQSYFISAEEIPLYRSFSIIGNDVLAMLPEHFQSVSFDRIESLRYCIMRRLRSHGTLTVRQLAERFAIPVDECQNILNSLTSNDQFIHGQLTNDSEDEQWSYRPNLERIHRASISLLRKDVKPATIDEFTRFLLHWQHRHPSVQQKDESGLHALLEMFQGFTLSSDVWEAEILKTRIQHYSGSLLRQLTQRGEYFCVGSSAGKSMWIERGAGNYYVPSPEQSTAELSGKAIAIREFLQSHGASFLSDIREHTTYTLAAINKAISELFWCGIITNDVVDEVLGVKRYRVSEGDIPEERFEIVNPRRNPLKSAAMKSVRAAFKQVPGWNGRWSLVHSKSILGDPVSIEEKAVRQAQQLLLRYGIVAREIAKREENLLPWSMLAMEFQRMEMRGEIRRGYFIEGLSGMQFALPDAVRIIDEIKKGPSKNEPSIVLNSCDPANPYGTGIDSDPTSGSIPRISRIAGNYIIFQSGAPIIWVENYGSRITYVESSEYISEGLQTFIDHFRAAHPKRQEIIVEYCNLLRPSESNAGNLLRSLGFYRDKVQTMRFDLR